MQSIVPNTLIDQVTAAIADGTRLSIRGSGSQPHITGQNTQPLSIGEHQGIIDYQPTELFIRVKAGTPIAQINAALAEHDQFIANSPLCINAHNSIGGHIATNLSGSTRLAFGALKDQILGLSIINGRGEYLEFGGQVMKNVAGFDLSRMMVGSCGAFGVITDVSLKVMPRPSKPQTLTFALADAPAREFANAALAQPLGITQATWDEGQLLLNINGGEQAAEFAQQKIGGTLSGMHDIWNSLDTLRHPIFNHDGRALWRIITDPLGEWSLDGQSVVDWAGGLRWFRTELSNEEVLAYCASVGATARRWDTKDALYQSALAAPIAQLTARIKTALDPHHIFDASNFPCT